MFCDRCGAQLLETNRYCSTCGKPVVGNMPLMPVQSRIAGHIRMLGILWLALSGMLLVGGVVMLAIFRTGGLWEGGFPPGSPPFLHDILSCIGILLLGGGVLGVGWTGGVAAARRSPSSPEAGAEPASGRRGCWAVWRQPVSAARMGRALAGKAARSAAFIRSRRLLVVVPRRVWIRPQRCERRT